MKIATMGNSPVPRLATGWIPSFINNAPANLDLIHGEPALVESIDYQSTIDTRAHGNTNNTQHTIKIMKVVSINTSTLTGVRPMGHGAHMSARPTNPPTYSLYEYVMKLLVI
jgi:hypothetical protein